MNFFGPDHTNILHNYYFSMTSNIDRLAANALTLEHQLAQIRLEQQKAQQLEDERLQASERVSDVMSAAHTLVAARTKFQNEAKLAFNMERQVKLDELKQAMINAERASVAARDKFYAVLISETPATFPSPVKLDGLVTPVEPQTTPPMQPMEPDRDQHIEATKNVPQGAAILTNANGLRYIAPSGTVASIAHPPPSDDQVLCLKQKYILCFYIKIKLLNNISASPGWGTLDTCL
jgi:hypothetical protein